MGKNIRVNILWNTFGSIFYCMCQWLLTIIVVKMASYEMAGYLSLAMTTSSSFSAIALFSMRNYQVSDVVGEYSSNIYVGSRILTCVFAFVCCFISVLLTNTFYQVLCTVAFMAIRVAESMVDVLHGINQKYNRYDYIGISYVLRGILTVLFFPVILTVSNNLPMALIVVALLNLMVVWGFDWRKTYALDSFGIIIWEKEMWKLLKRCMPIVVFTFLLSLENLIPKTILQRKFGAEWLGIYSSMASPTLVVQVFASVVFSPFLPTISEIINKKEIKKFKDMLHKIYWAFAGMSIIVSLGAVLFGRWGLKILFGEGILRYYLIFMPIVWCTILTGIVCVLSSVLIALRKIKSLVWGMVFDFMLCLVLSQYFVQYMGMNGVSVVQIISLGIYIVYMVIVCEIQ